MVFKAKKSANTNICFNELCRGKQESIDCQQRAKTKQDSCRLKHTIKLYHKIYLEQEGLVPCNDCQKIQVSIHYFAQNVTGKFALMFFDGFTVPFQLSFPWCCSRYQFIGECKNILLQIVVE